MDDLDNYVEMELERLASIKVDFEIDDAMAKLERLNLVTKNGDRYVAVPIETALERLDYAWDNYFTPFITDFIENMTYTPGAPRFTGTGLPAAGIPTGGEANLTINRIPAGDAGSPAQSGLLLMYRDARSAREADAIAVQP